MGSWGTGNLENDGALDWIGDLVDSRAGWDVVATALRNVTEASPGEYLESHACEEALAAAELVASAKDAPPADLTDAAKVWVDAHRGNLPATLARLAATAARRIRTASELRDLFHEDDNTAGEWDRAIAGLEARLMIK